MSSDRIAELLTTMSHIHIPPEVLLKILAHVRDNGDPKSHLDLLSCSMVSRFWFDCAWPLAAEFVIQDIPLDLDTYSAAQIGYVADAITRLRQLRAWKTTLTSVATIVNKLLFQQTSRADATVRLMHALQLPSKALEIYIPKNFVPKQVAKTQDFISKLHSDTTSLYIFGRNFHPDNKSLEILETLEPLTILIHDLRHQLQNITITGTYPPSFIRALSNCPNIRSVSIKSTFGVSDLMTAVFSWPELRSLKILGKSSDIDPIVEQLVINTPKHLESLRLEHCKTPQLRNLIISLAPRLVHLALPSTLTESPNAFLALITSLDMPCLRYLDLGQLGYFLTAENVVQRHWAEGHSDPISLLRWPKLQRINLRFCLNTPPLFLQLVMASCPALEGVRLGGMRSEKMKAILADAGWTQSARTVGHEWDECNIAVTFSRPGGDVWESEEWVEMMKFEALMKKFCKNDIYSPISPDDFETVEGGFIVRCVGIECGNEFV